MNTDDYEGHTPAPWKIYYDKWNKTGWYIDSIARYDVGEGDTVCELFGTAQKQDPTAKLIAAAPDLLAEVKRLREGRLDLINEVIRIINNKTGERVDADLHDYIIDRLVNE